MKHEPKMILLEPQRPGDVRRLAQILAQIIWEQAKKDMLQSQQAKDAA